MLHGIDVSSHQGAVDWPAVASAGIGFAFVKASGGAWYQNVTFASGWQGARAAGLVRGAYHYAFESSGQDFPGPGPEAEAEYFLATVLGQGPLEPGDMLVLDIEEAPPDGDAPAWALAWCRHVEQRVGFRPLVYSGRWFTDPRGFASYPDLARYPLWLAAYQTQPPAPPAPWPAVTFWQHSDQGTVAGVSGPCDLNVLMDAAGPIAGYGKPAEGGPPVPEYPSYDPTYPAFAQNDDWSCAPTSTRWGLWAYDRQPTEAWLESSMLSQGVVTTQYGLMDASGAGLADWITREYGEFGYSGQNDPSVTFDDVALEAQARRHPLLLGGRTWNHWSGVRGFDGARLLLANPAAGWMGVTQSMSREQFKYLGPFSMVRLTHPAAEGQPVPPNGGVPSDPFGPWRATVGSGLLELMAQDKTQPAQRASTWLPLGISPADVEECLGTNGVMYRWALTVGQGWRYGPS